MNERHAVVLACAQPLLTAGLRAALAGSFDVAAVTGTTQETVDAVAVGPGLCLLVPPLDQHVPAVLSALRAARVRTPVVVLSQPRADDGVPMIDAVRLGAAGWLTLDISPERLTHALRDVLAGGTALPRSATRHLVEAVRGRTPAVVLRSDGRRVALTDRERDVLDVFRRGGDTAGAAEVLGVSAVTVRGYLHAARAKVCVRSTAELLRVVDAERLGQPHTTA